MFLDNGINISEWLLQKGFAKTLTIPPNVKYVSCYKNAESQAQQQELRLWKLKRNQIKTIGDLKTNSKGYIRLKGKISNVKKQKKTIVLELEHKNKKPVEIRIRKKNLRYFKGLDPDKLLSQEVIVSGILKNKRAKRTITLNHSSQLEILPAMRASDNRIAPKIKWSITK